MPGQGARCDRTTASVLTRSANAAGASTDFVSQAERKALLTSVSQVGERRYLYQDQISGWYSSRRVALSHTGFNVGVEEDTNHPLGAHLLGPRVEVEEANAREENEVSTQKETRMDTHYSRLVDQPMQSDLLLLEQACAGDEAAFETLVHRYQRLLYHFAQAYLGDEDAQDAVQFILLQLYRCMPALQGEQSPQRHSIPLKYWLLRVARNHCLDLARRRKRTLSLFSELEPCNQEDGFSMLEGLLDPEPLPEEVAEHREVQEHLQAAIQQLPLKPRAIVWLRYTEGLTFVEIARSLRMSEMSVKTTFYRACAKLRRMLSSQLERSTA